MKLDIIKSALRNFPTLQTRLRARGTSDSSPLRGSPSRYSTPTSRARVQQPHVASALELDSGDNTRGEHSTILVQPTHTLTTPTSDLSPGKITPRNKAATFRCLLRDRQQCTITGRPYCEGFGIEAAHIIPYAFANQASCRNLDLWKMLKMFYGVEDTNRMCTTLASNVNSLGNLISLDNSIHSMFDNGTFKFEPLTLHLEPIPVFNSHIGSSLLQVNYRKPLTTPELIQSTRIYRIYKENEKRVGPLFHKSKVPILYIANAQEYVRTIPLPGYFALRKLILDLQDLCPLKDGV